MKKVITLILLTASFALADDPKPQVDPAQMVVALKAENDWLKKEVQTLQLKIALMNAINQTNNDLDALTSKKPAEQAVPIVPKTQP